MLSAQQQNELLAVLEHAGRTAPLVHSTIHGEHHWQCVARIGAHLARATNGADVRFVLLFAVLHDSRRENENHDPEHGHRAAEFVDELAAAGRVSLDPGPRSRLRDAIARHSDGEATSDQMIGVCWDADRLCLPRVGISPDRTLLSTAIGRDSIGWARTQLDDPIEDWRRIVRGAVAPLQEPRTASG